MPVLLIAGGSRGIGASTARLAARDGYDVAVNYLSNEKAAANVVAAVQAAGRRAIALQGDMSREDDIERVFDEAAHALGICGESRGQDFDGDVTAQSRVSRAIDFPHAAGAKGRDDFIGTEVRSSGKWHLNFSC